MLLPFRKQSLILKFPIVVIAKWCATEIAGARGAGIVSEISSKIKYDLLTVIFYGSEDDF